MTTKKNNPDPNPSEPTIKIKVRSFVRVVGSFVVAGVVWVYPEVAGAVGLGLITYAVTKEPSGPPTI